MREELNNFELGQIWITDDSLGAKADEQDALMYAHFGTHSIPLHVIVDGTGRELARFEYSPLMTPEDYLAFLKRGMDAFRQ